MKCSAAPGDCQNCLPSSISAELPCRQTWMCNVKLFGACLGRTRAPWPLVDALGRLQEASVIRFLQRLVSLRDEGRGPLDALLAVGNLLGELSKPLSLETLGQRKGNISEKSQSQSNHEFKERGIKYCRIKASEVTRGKKIIRKEQIRRKDDWCIWSFFGFYSLVEKAKQSQYIYFSPIFLQNRNCKLLIFCYIFKESGQNNPKYRKIIFYLVQKERQMLLKVKVLSISGRFLRSWSKKRSSFYKHKTNMSSMPGILVHSNLGFHPTPTPFASCWL